MAIENKMRLVGGRFYQNVRRLLKRCRQREETAIIPDDVVQFSSVLTLDAPEREVESLLPPQEGDEQYRMAVHHFGLLGTLGALPLRYTEWLIDRRYRYGDESAQAFIDIFTHRLLSLRFQAWQKYRLYINTELQPHTELQIHAEWQNYRALPAVIPAVAGQLMADTTQRSHPACVGLLATPVRSMVNLQQLLQRELSMAVNIQPFKGRWQYAEQAHCCCLGRSLLGDNPMLGRAYWDIQSGFHIQLGPFAARQRAAFMPGNEQYRKLTQWVWQFAGPLLSFSLELLVQHSGQGNLLNGSRQLGWDGCLGNTGESNIQRLYLAECTGPYAN
ncbi:type VI secretion system baseplate subunit TssG [Photorhabdus laumondii]|uniref:Type VI secretion system baseplate subunit TssG n=1 Tax=Photorhabdus laumondii subsp. clarkei TaxID=2029685 RepID=A0A329VI10_9GAMM|nr:type VI secretion system baseplate subunit TssG [Photorhabdus laumondii]RAW91870.1 type VI secretion system baseplate subunit TssG [Photorhabdus laumondii subsp. clarkei]